MHLFISFFVTDFVRKTTCFENSQFEISISYFLERRKQDALDRREREKKDLEEKKKKEMEMMEKIADAEMRRRLREEEERKMYEEERLAQERYEVNKATPISIYNILLKMFLSSAK